MDLEKSTWSNYFKHFHTGNERLLVVHVFMHLENVLQSDWEHKSVHCGTKVGS